MFLEIITVPTVIALFKTVEPKKTAAVIAGSLFVALGFFIYSKSYRARKSLTLYASFAHLFFFSLPMLTKRIFYWNSDFEDILFYGMSGPHFHKVSEILFVVLLTASLVDFARVKIKDRSSRA